jgi:hypothetical protein
LLEISLAEGCMMAEEESRGARERGGGDKARRLGSGARGGRGMSQELQDMRKEGNVWKARLQTMRLTNHAQAQRLGCVYYQCSVKLPERKC